jgi:hypothetical protein
LSKGIVGDTTKVERNDTKEEEEDNVGKEENLENRDFSRQACFAALSGRQIKKSGIKQVAARV